MHGRSVTNSRSLIIYVDAKRTVPERAYSHGNDRVRDVRTADNSDVSDTRLSSFLTWKYVV